MVFRNNLHGLLFILLSFSLKSLAQDDLTLPRGRLGLKWDTGTQQDTWWHFSSLITRMRDGGGQDISLGDTNAFSDGMLVAAAMEGWLEMQAILDTPGTIEQGDRPHAMSALIVGNELYLSSSIKRNGGGFRVLFPQSKVSVALERCSAVTCDLRATEQAKKNGAMHRTAGNCGEPGAVHLFYKQHPDTPGNELPQGSRIVTVHRVQGNLEIFKPCGSGNIDPEHPVPDWGCTRFLNDLNIREISPSTARVDIPNVWTIDYSTVCL